MGPNVALHTSGGILTSRKIRRMGQLDLTGSNNPRDEVHLQNYGMNAKVTPQAHSDDTKAKVMGHAQSNVTKAKVTGQERSDAANIAQPISAKKMKLWLANKNDGISSTKQCVT